MGGASFGEHLVQQMGPATASSQSLMAGAAPSSPTVPHSRTSPVSSVVAPPHTWCGAIGSPVLPAKTSSTITNGGSRTGGAAYHGTAVPHDGDGNSGSAGGGGGGTIHGAGLPLQQEHTRRSLSGAEVPQTSASDSGGCDLRGCSGVPSTTPSSSTGSIFGGHTKSVAHRISGGGGDGGDSGSSAPDQVHGVGSAAVYAAKADNKIDGDGGVVSTKDLAEAGQHKLESETHSAVICAE